ncbi:MAG TPA: class I SAM-dependent methyltransferase [Dehalococcoidales bacterium]
MAVHHWHFFDETERRKWQNPEAILSANGLKTGMVFMDIGCGEGFFTLAAAGIVGSAGKVYGIDIDEQAIAEVRRKVGLIKASNLELIVSPAEKALPCRACADMIFFGIVLHDFDDPAKVLKNAHQMLKPTGKLVNLDWKKKAGTPFGPPVSKRFDEATATGLIESAGFKVLSTQDSGSFNYIVTARPDVPPVLSE